MRLKKLQLKCFTTDKEIETEFQSLLLEPHYGKTAYLGFKGIVLCEIHFDYFFHNMSVCPVTEFHRNMKVHPLLLTLLAPSFRKCVLKLTVPAISPL